MRNFVPTFFLLTLLSLSDWSLSFSQDFHIGQSVVLEATKPAGVPIHRKPAPSYLKHVPTGTPATILKIAPDGPWLFLRLPHEVTAWVHTQYIHTSSPPASSSSTPDLSPTSTGDEKAVWADREHCETVVNQGRRMPAEPSSHLRIATWNLRWFPQGRSPDQPEEFAEPTDLNWLTCVIRWMQTDILAVQEILATPEATVALTTVTENLTTQTGQTWRWHRQPCGRPDDHHLGLLWNDSRVALTQFDSLWQFNAKAENGSHPCTYGLRPGQYARVQSRTVNGVDFHLIAVHLKSGPTVFDVEERHKALNRIDQAIAPYLNQDQDVVIVGDFNTMGAGDWKSRESEIKNLRRHLEKEKPGFTDLEPHPQCSHYFRGRSGWLDHILVSREMKEITVTSSTVTGYCAIAGCRRIHVEYPRAYRHLSDHCPVVVEIENRDQDY